jgi:hypothetical protein
MSTPDATEPEPADVMPERETTHETNDVVDDSDEDDEDDVPPAPPAPREAPPGFHFAASAPTAEQLTFSKEASTADTLVGRHILYKWPVVGWCVGQIVERNKDARSFKMIEGERIKVNFLIFYEIDQQTVKRRRCCASTSTTVTRTPRGRCSRRTRARAGRSGPLTVCT